MKRTTKNLLCLSLGGLMLGGCFTDDPAPADEVDVDTADADTSEPDPSAGSTDDGPTPPTPPGTTGPGPDTDDPDSGTADPPDTDGDNEFDFDDSPPEDYTQIDRSGMPAINSAVITDREDYNAASPADDAAGLFVPQIIENLTGLHAALDDDLIGAELVPCAVEACVGQAAPLVVPDTLSVDLSTASGFPNGRLPTDPVMDVTLAVVLLDLSAPGQGVTTLVGLNPTANDLEFSDEFPYFAAPHQ